MDGEIAKSVAKHEKLEAKIRNATLKLKLLENWKKRVMDADRRAAAALLQITEMIGELEKLAQQLSELNGRLKKFGSECGRQLTRLIIMLVEQPRIDKMFPGVIERSVSVFYCFVNTLRGDLVHTFRIDLKKRIRTVWLKVFCPWFTSPELVLLGCFGSRIAEVK